MPGIKEILEKTDKIVIVDEDFNKLHNDLLADGWIPAINIKWFVNKGDKYILVAPDRKSAYYFLGYLKLDPNKWEHYKGSKEGIWEK